MSTISRRDFMKTAGVMTLAVAASGVLAGCSADSADDAVTEVSSTSVTIGKWTVSIKDAKLYSVTTYTGSVGVDGAKTESTTDEYLVVLCNNKFNGDANSKEIETPYFSIDTSVKNVEEEAAVTAACAKKIFSLSTEPVEGFTYQSALDYDQTTPTGTYFYYAYKVAAYEDETLKTPSFQLIVKDEDAITLAKLTASIPAATELKASKLTETLGIEA